jgi:hypothetical protein
MTADAATEARFKVIEHVRLGAVCEAASAGRLPEIWQSLFLHRNPKKALVLIRKSLASVDRARAALATFEAEQLALLADIEAELPAEDPATQPAPAQP